MHTNKSVVGATTSVAVAPYLDACILHIGPHKSGSTSIQEMMASNKTRLLEYGIIYPGSVWHAQVASYFARSRKNFIFNIHSHGDDETSLAVADRGYMQEIEAEIKASGARCVVFSYEGFIDLDEHGLVEMKAWIEKLAKKTRIVYYARHPLSFAPSEISQRLRMGFPSGLDGPTLDLPVLRHTGYLNKFIAVFGKNAISVCEFHRDTLTGGDVRRDFLQKIGIDEFSIAEFDLPQNAANSSISAPAAYLAEQIQLIEDPGLSGGRFAEKYSSLLASINGSPLRLTCAQAEMILAASERHTEFLRHTFGLTMRPHEFVAASVDYRDPPSCLNAIAHYFKKMLTQHPPVS